MKKKGLTDIICIIDRSGSMIQIQDDAIGGFNAFLKEQQEIEGEARLTMVLFDNEYIVVHNGTNIQHVKPLNSKTYVPRGSTALLDAIGRGINTELEMLGRLPNSEKPEKIMLIVLTDGQENDSREYKYKDIKKLIRKVESDGWKTLFLCNEIEESAVQWICDNMGFSRGCCATFCYGNARSKGYKIISQVTTSYRTDTV